MHNSPAAAAFDQRGCRAPRVKFHLANATGNVITGLGAGWVRVGATEYRGNLVLTQEAVAEGWAAHGFDGLDEADFARLGEGKPDVVLLGTGSSLRFPDPRLTRPLVE